jgi:phage terminase small subunit
MGRGGHAKSGPVAFDQAQRELRGTKTRPRPRHRPTKVTPSAPMPICEGPPHLTEAERSQWAYYAPLLAERLTLEARDTLAKYCTALATVERLKAQMAADEYRDLMITTTVDGAGNEHRTAKPNPLLVQLRQWVLLCRGYESDLLLSPAAAIRAPKAAAPESTADPLAALLARRYGL